MSSDNRPTTANPLMTQAIFQALYQLAKQRTQNEGDGKALHEEPARERIESPIPKPEPECDAEAIHAKLLSGESVDVDIVGWRAEHLARARQYPRVHLNCPRILWKIVDRIEQRDISRKLEPLPFARLAPEPPSPANIIQLLMLDIFTLSQNHDFMHRSAGRKLATLVDPVQAVSIHRELLEYDSAGFDSDGVVCLEEALGRMSDEIQTLNERVALNRQVLVLEPGRTTAIRKLAYSLIMLYDRTSNDVTLYEAHALQRELVQRDHKDKCTIMDQIEGESREKSVIEDVEIRVTQHVGLVQASPITHVSCPSRLLTLVEDMEISFRGSIKPKDQVALIGEAVRLVDRGIGISEQLRALNALYRVLRDTDSISSRSQRATLLNRINSLVSSTGHRIAPLSWLQVSPERRQTRPRSSQDNGTLAWDAVAWVESETMPTLQWLNPELLAFNDQQRNPDTMADFQAHFRRAALQSGNFDDMPTNSP